jgi:hypothetical protein
MKNIIIVLTILIMVVGCSWFRDDSADRQMQKQTESAMKEANTQIGMPAIVNYQERKLAKMIFELRDKEDLITNAYIVNHMEGKLVFIGKCIGYGLPYSIQYTNPEKVIRYSGSSVYSGSSPSTISQADPNGLFMPQGLSATWLMMINPETNEPRPVYVEPEILVSPFKLH